MVGGVALVVGIQLPLLLYTDRLECDIVQESESLQGLLRVMRQHVWREFPTVSFWRSSGGTIGFLSLNKFILIEAAATNYQTTRTSPEDFVVRLSADPGGAVAVDTNHSIEVRSPASEYDRFSHHIQPCIAGTCPVFDLGR